MAESRLSESHASTFCTLIDKAATLAAERNDNLHALWTTACAGQPKRFRPFFNRKANALDWRSRVVTIKELRRVEGEMKELLDALERARNAWSIAAISEL
ncbi:MAG: hypothetical protein FJX55_16480 [Alphaproteobacteria bacterium]|nr:hypothetical protein [Alphaproteobacteria bacterium]